MRFVTFWDLCSGSLMGSELRARLGRALNAMLRGLHFSRKIKDVAAAENCDGNCIRKIILVAI